MQRLGSQASSSSLSSSQWLSVPNLDGPQSQPQLKPLPQLPTTNAASTNQRRWNAPNVAAGRVADRIRAINSLQQLPSNVPKRSVEPILPPYQPPALSPEYESRRASPFPRRDSAQSPIRPETPLSQSRSLISPLVHCPMPKRYQTQLSTNIEKVAMPNDEQLMCYRHGRKLKLRKSVPAGMDKAFSGAYIPTGPMIRQQVDPLSPWSVGRRLAKTSGTTVSPDICSDCLAEQRILEREIESNSRTPRTRADQSLKSASSSTFTEPGTPPDPDQPSNVLIGTTIDNQTIQVPGAAVSDLPPDKFGGIVATDLGDMIDAIIVEHSGSLGKVISNIRNGMPDSDWTQKLSRDLAKVSEAVATIPEDNIRQAPAFSRNINGRRSIILDASPDSLRQRAKTMPELLDLVEAATEEFGVRHLDSRKQEFNLDRPHLPGDFPHTPSSPSSSSVDSPLVPSVTQPASSTKSGASILPVTPPQAPKTALRSEPSVAANQVLKVAPTTTSAMAIEPSASDADEDEATLIERETLLPSTNLSIQDSTSDADEDEATLVEREVLLPSTNPPVKSTEAPSTSREAPTAQQRSRIPKATTIPLTRPLYVPSNTPRSGPARPKPSTVAKQHQQQRTFQQGWLREAAVIERAERRTRSRSRGANRV
jgi:hypothetical protein